MGFTKLRELVLFHNINITAKSARSSEILLRRKSSTLLVRYHLDKRTTQGVTFPLVNLKE